MTTMPENETRMMELAKLRPAPYNPRSITELEKKALGASMDEFGLVQPIIWNEVTGNVVGGHQRLTIMKERGVTHTNVVVIRVDPVAERRLNLSLNRISGDWVESELRELIQHIEEQGGVLDDLGFTSVELEDYLVPFEMSNDLDSIETATANGEGGGSKGSKEVTCPSCGHDFKPE